MIIWLFLNFIFSKKNLFNFFFNTCVIEQIIFADNNLNYKLRFYVINGIKWSLFKIFNYLYAMQNFMQKKNYLERSFIEIYLIKIQWIIKMWKKQTKLKKL